VEELRAIDVFEHIAFSHVPVTKWVQTWMDEAWRVLQDGGILEMRLPSYANPYTWRDPTHYRAFHPESFLYWCPEAPGTVWRDFGRYYFGVGYSKWWEQVSVIEHCKDYRYTLRKTCKTF
jgi:hypothetical protein